MTTTLINGGQVYDPSSHKFSQRDICVTNGLISEHPGPGQDADVIIDAQDHYVTPGLIDLHCHIFDHPLHETSRLAADRIGVRQGVTCLLDTGSAGAATIDAFKDFVIETQETHTFALCNIGSPGLPGVLGGHSATPELVSLARTVRAVERNREFVLGIKVLASSSHTGLMGIEAVKMAKKAAELTDTPLMVHIGNAPPVIEEILELLRPGDILTHAYHGKIGGVLGHKHQVIPEFKAAVERGVYIDIAHGRSSFSFKTCETALAQGMPVHTISSDLHRGNIDRTVVSLARTMTKFRMLGLSLEDVVRATTLTPAVAIGLDAHGFGKLETGKPANITLFRELDVEREVEDAEGEVRKTETWIEPVAAIIGDTCHKSSEVI